MKWDLENTILYLQSLLGDNYKDINILENRDASIFISVTFEILSNDSIVLSKILSNMKEDIEIFFYDYYHPQLSDPGAYVTAKVDKKGNYYYYLGNHGWSSSTYAITFSRLLRYAMKNVKYNKKSSTMGSFRLNFGKSKSTRVQYIEVIESKRLNYTGLYIGSKEILEVNDSYLAIIDDSKYKKEVIPNTKIIRCFHLAYYLKEEIYSSVKLNGNIDMFKSNYLDKSIKVKISYRDLS